jgi:hypothetical protein
MSEAIKPRQKTPNMNSTANVSSFNFAAMVNHYFRPAGFAPRAEFVKFDGLKKAIFTNGETLRLTPAGWLPAWLKISPSGEVVRA